MTMNKIILKTSNNVNNFLTLLKQLNKIRTKLKSNYQTFKQYKINKLLNKCIISLKNFNLIICSSKCYSIELLIFLAQKNFSDCI